MKTPPVAITTAKRGVDSHLRWKIRTLKIYAKKALVFQSAVRSVTLSRYEFRIACVKT